MIKIGQSTDIHPFAPNRKLILGGVDIPYEKGLDGHSDADVLTHAIIECIIGALGLGDIGKHFPDTNPKYKGISSLVLLEETKTLLKQEGYHILNVDSIIILEEPKLAPFIEFMKNNLAAALEISTSCINIKATRGEKLGFIGRKEGIMAQAVCLLERDL